LAVLAGTNGVVHEVHTLDEEAVLVADFDVAQWSNGDVHEQLEGKSGGAERVCPVDGVSGVERFCPVTR